MKCIVFDYTNNKYEAILDIFEAKQMNEPIMCEPYTVTKDIIVLPSYFPIPGLGILPVNAFVIKASEPVLVDTGLVPLSDEFMEKLSSVINPKDLHWLWLTHTDQDHIGSLNRVLKESPKLQVITSYLAAGKMSLFNPLPMDRIYFLNPGQSLNVGDRFLTAVKPPLYDAPETTGFWDSKTEAFFSSDCFGALMSEPEQDAAGIERDKLRKGMIFWATVDSPWSHNVDRKLFDKSLNFIRELSSKIILSTHLPVAMGISEELIEYLRAVPDAQPFIGPDRQAFEAMLKQMAGAKT